jgi:hypothetical protein
MKDNPLKTVMNPSKEDFVNFLYELRNESMKII